MSLNEYDLDFEGLKVHCYEGGAGFPILMLHGSGAGTASASNWALVMDDLAQHYHVLAADLIGFGLSGRKVAEPYFDIELWKRQAQFLLDHLQEEGPIGIIGHSLSGFLALHLAARNPRMTKVMVTGSAGAHFLVPEGLTIGWSFPTSESDLQKMYSYIVADPSRLSEEFYRNRLNVLRQGDYSDYFSKMFAGNKQSYLDQIVLREDEINRIKCDVILVHGAQDQVVPFESALLPLADAISQADVVRLANCGHGPALEQPKKFFHIALGFFE